MPKGKRARRVVLADAAVPGEAGEAARARRLQQRARHGARRRTRRPSTSPSVRRSGTRAAASTTPARSRRSGSTRRARRRRARFSSRAAPAASTGAARPRIRRPGFVYVNAHDTSLVGWIERRRPGLNYGNGVAGSTTALRPRQRQRRRPVLHVQRAAQGRDRPHAREPAVSASTVGPAGRRQREHRRDRLGEHARPHRGAARRQAAHRRQRQRRSDGHRRRPGVRRRDQRSPLPRVRFEDGQGAVVHTARGDGEREPDDVSREEREAVRRGRRHRHARRVRAAIDLTT